MQRDKGKGGMKESSVSEAHVQGGNGMLGQKLERWAEEVWPAKLMTLDSIPQRRIERDFLMKSDWIRFFSRWITHSIFPEQVNITHKFY